MNQDREALHQLGQEPCFYRGDAKRQPPRAILDLHDNKRKTPVILIDEGHLLSKEMMEEIRFLTNFKMDSYSPMCLILLGQPELRRILQMQIYEAIVQRVNVRFHLPGMGVVGVVRAYFGKKYGSAPMYGEIMEQYRMSEIGYYSGYTYFRNYFK